MCDVLSGHIATQEGKDWGKVIILSGIHHEKDREHLSKYGEDLIAWETKDNFNFSCGFSITHSCGKKLTKKQKETYLEILGKFAKNFDIMNHIKTLNDEVKYYYCYSKADLEEVWSTITEDKYKYEYCLDIVNRKELWSTITDDHYKYLYCRYVEDREELWSTITSDHYKYLYCRYVKDRKELWSTITSNQYKFLYCRDVKDRKELWSTITGNNYNRLYCREVVDREELH